MARLHLVAALARNRVIGLGNRLPWHLPQDLRHFKRLTWGQTLLMGRQTFDSIGTPLVGRRNLVLSRSPKPPTTEPQPCGLSFVSSVDEALELVAATGSDLYVIGGEQVYALCLPRATDLWLTEIEQEFEGDAWFPPWQREDFALLERTTHHAAQGWDYNFSHYRRRS